MNERLAKAEAVFHEALELPPEQREAFLLQACGKDAELCREVEALLRASGVADRWLKDDPMEGERPHEPQRFGATGGLPITEKAGDRIGRYKLREQLGEGGCGVVYVAEQEEPVRRRVALKVIKLGMGSKSVVARFEVERQALAMMDHPNIAKVLDAGATDTGRPYFVMELVRGIRITDYCDQNNLSTGERLDLFIKVCQAVQHAHQKGIIHRDLKPSNILVTLHDGVPVPKVIDFGIAKATEGRLTDLTVYTELHQFIGTPAYISPEQAEMSGLDIDTRADIYSLGVLLYELLTGQTPFSSEELVRAGFDAMLRTIREKEPVRPSTRLSTMLAGELTATAKRHGAHPPELIHLIRGDLDWIVMKCLEKDRTRRYETANGLATDLKRHLSNEPVAARPPSAAYRFHKLVRRNKLAFAATGAVAAALVGGLAIALAALARERSANRLAEQRLMAAVQQVENFLTNDLPAVRGLAGSTKATESMLRNTLSFMSGLAPNAEDNPEFLLASARVHANLATLQGSRWTISLGDPEAALASASNAWTLLRSVPTSALPRVRVEEMTYRAEEATGMALEALGREDEALAHYERMLALATELDQQLPRTGNCRWTSEAHKRLAGYFMAKEKWDQMREQNDHFLRDPYLLTNAASEDLGRLSFTGGTLWGRAIYYQRSVSNRNVALALDYFRQSLSFFEAYLKRANSDQDVEYAVALSLDNIGGVLCEQRNYAEGLPIIDEALRRMESLADRDKANWIFQDLLIGFLLDHARILATAAKAGVLSKTESLRLLEQARTSYQRCLERMTAFAAYPSRQKSWVGKGADGVKRRLEETMYDLGEAYQDAGRPDSAEAFYRERLAQNGSGLASLGLGRLLLQRAKSDTENPDRAAERTREGERLLREYLATGLEHPETLWAMLHLANSYFVAGRREEALKLREEVLALRRRLLGPEHPDILSAMYSLAISYFDAGRREEALKLREEVLALRRKVLGPEDPDTLWAADYLAISYHDAGRREEALKLREEVLVLCRKVLGPQHPETLRIMHNLALSYSDAGRREEALKLREEVLAFSRKVNGPEHPDTLRAMHILAISYFDAGRRQEALKLREEVLALRRKVLGPEHPDTLGAMHNLALSYFAAGRREEALKLREELLPLRRKVNGPEHPDTLWAMHNLSFSYFDAGRREEALKLQEEVLPLRRKVLGPEHPDTLWVMDNLASAYRLERRFAEAEPLYREQLQGQTTRYPATNDAVASATYGLAGLLHDWAWSERGAADKSKPAERAREAERLLRDCLATRAKTLGPESSRLARTRSRLGDALVAIAVIDSTLTAEARLAQFTEAESLLLKAHEALRQHETAEPKYKRDALERLVRLYEAWDKPEKRSEWQQKLEALKAGETKSAKHAEEDTQ